jgi:hypothetical protein
MAVTVNVAPVPTAENKFWDPWKQGFTSNPNPQPPQQAPYTYYPGTVYSGAPGTVASLNEAGTGVVYRDITTGQVVGTAPQGAQIQQSVTQEQIREARIQQYSSAAYQQQQVAPPTERILAGFQTLFSPYGWYFLYGGLTKNPEIQQQATARTLGERQYEASLPYGSKERTAEAQKIVFGVAESPVGAGVSTHIGAGVAGKAMRAAVAPREFGTALGITTNVLTSATLGQAWIEGGVTKLGQTAGVLAFSAPFGIGGYKAGLGTPKYEVTYASGVQKTNVELIGEGSRPVFKQSYEELINPSKQIAKEKSTIGNIYEVVNVGRSDVVTDMGMRSQFWINPASSETELVIMNPKGLARSSIPATAKADVTNIMDISGQKLFQSKATVERYSGDIGGALAGKEQYQHLWGAGSLVGEAGGFETQAFLFTKQKVALPAGTIMKGEPPFPKTPMSKTPFEAEQKVVPRSPIPEATKAAPGSAQNLEYGVAAIEKMGTFKAVKRAVFAEEVSQPQSFLTNPAIKTAQLPAYLAAQKPQLGTAQPQIVQQPQAQRQIQPQLNWQPQANIQLQAQRQIQQQLQPQFNWQPQTERQVPGFGQPTMPPPWNFWSGGVQKEERKKRTFNIRMPKRRTFMPPPGRIWAKRDPITAMREAFVQRKARLTPLGRGSEAPYARLIGGKSAGGFLFGGRRGGS